MITPHKRADTRETNRILRDGRLATLTLVHQLRGRAGVAGGSSNRVCSPRVYLFALCTRLERVYPQRGRAATVA